MMSVAPAAVPEAADVMALAPDENFPVASRVLPHEARGHLMALYGFARLVDQLGDEIRGDRLRALDWLAEELERAYEGRASHPLLVRLEPTLRQCSLPAEPFMRLIEANRADQRVSRYETWEDLLGYCHLSADPVGELVLGVFGLATPARIRLSDAICTALQLTEHWQDVAEDRARGRVYLPQEHLREHGCTEEMLDSRFTPPPLRDLMAAEVARTRRLFRRGAPLIGTLRGRPRLAVAGFLGGGLAALRAIERSRFEVLSGPPRAGSGARLGAMLLVLLVAGRRP